VRKFRIFIDGDKDTAELQKKGWKKRNHEGSPCWEGKSTTPEAEALAQRFSARKPIVWKGKSWVSATDSQAENG